MTDNNKNLIYIPKDGNYIEILGYRIDGFDSFETFCEHLKKYAELEETVERLQAEIEMLEDAKNAYKDIVDTCEKGAVKEFWEKLKVEGEKKVDYYTPDGCDNYFRNGTLCGYVAMKEAGDSILKEMVGDGK